MRGGGGMRKNWGNILIMQIMRSVSQYGKKYEIEISRPNQSQMNRLDHHLSEMCDFMETYSVLIFRLLGVLLRYSFFIK